MREASLVAAMSCNSMSTVRFVWLNQRLSRILQVKRPVRSVACGCYPISTVDLRSPATPRSQHPSSAMRRSG